jgi:hypothetical protein
MTKSKYSHTFLWNCDTLYRIINGQVGDVPIDVWNDLHNFLDELTQYTEQKIVVSSRWFANAICFRRTEFTEDRPSSHLWKAEDGTVITICDAMAKKLFDTSTTIWVRKEQ